MGADVFTLRDVFYRDPSLFDNQGVSDKLIDLLSELLGEKRGALNIRASPRGMFAGSAITLLLKSGEEITASATRGQTIPVEEDIERIDVRDDISFVVVVEKEVRTYTRVHGKSLKIFSRPLLNGLQGKGYPDLATRDLFKRLAQDLPPWVPITVLVDADPYGLDILNQFVKACDGQAGERVQWIGVFGTEWTELGIEPQQLLPLKPTDCRKAFKMLRETPDLPSRWREELQHMLFLQRKAEIECLSSL
ncbi:DNA topoisomerase IV alpha subunit, partial [Dacryopinax primogenitus]